MRLNLEQIRSYSGDVDQAPLWARWSVMPWYRRLLAAPLTIYLVIATGLYVDLKFADHWHHWLCLPVYILVYRLAVDSNHLAYRNCFLEAERAQGEERERRL